MVERIRRVVTGHDRDGKSIFIMDGKAPNILEMKSMPGVAATPACSNMRLAKSKLSFEKREMSA